MTRVVVIGAKGRMGSQVVKAVNEADGLELVGEFDQGDDLASLSEVGAQVAVDFTHPGVVMQNLDACISQGVNVVVGTSGFDPERIAEVEKLLAGNPGVGVVIASNFGIAAVLMMKFSELAAPHFESVEIVELHHPDKADAPSGTARRTAELVTEAREVAGVGPAPDATVESLDGARGAKVGEVPIHAVRARGLVAHQEVIFGTSGELLTIRHDSMNRESFMPGVVLAVREVANRPGLTFGLEHLLGL